MEAAFYCTLPKWALLVYIILSLDFTIIHSGGGKLSFGYSN